MVARFAEAFIFASEVISVNIAKKVAKIFLAFLVLQFCFKKIIMFIIIT